ncbi:TPA: psl/pyoverdine operon transcriptional regulator PpyR [Pseudomonas aeruginosa]|nr:psl/pyoverdine operon transcriptional regulator PpyR [Pseudomonas aeruginosa]
MNALFDCPRRVLRIGHGLLAAGLALLVAGVIVAYFLDRYLNMPALVFSHALVILGPTLLKIGYVMRLSALFRMRRPGWEVCCASA